MALNPQFPNWANGANSSLVLTGPYTVTGLALYQLPQAYVNTGFGAAFVAEGGTTQSPTSPEGDYNPNPYIEGAGTISGDPTVGETLTFTPPTVTGTPAPVVVYDWCYYGPGNTLVEAASGESYTLQPSDLSKVYVVRTTATNSVGSVFTVTTPIGPILGTIPVITNPGAISPADVFPGQTLTVTSLPTAVGSPTPTISWNWVQIGGPTPDVPVQLGGNTYVAKESDAGYQIAIKVSASNSSGTVEATSPASDCNAAAPAVLVKPRITILNPYVGVREGGVYGRFSGFPTPQTTDWGFAWQTGGGGSPVTYTPIPGSNKTVSYVVNESDIDKQIVFYQTVANSAGSLTSYSDPTGTIPENLGVKTPSRMILPQDGIVNAGDTLTGVPATFTPSTGVTVSYQWGYLETDQSVTPIPGATSTSYVTTEVDLNKSLVFTTTGSCTTPVQSVSSQSNSSGPVRQGLTIVSQPTAIFAGPRPMVGELIQLTPGVTNPANNLSTPSGPTQVTYVAAYRVDPEVGRVLIGDEQNPDLADLYLSAPPETYGQPIAFDVFYQYSDGLHVSTARGTVVTPPVNAVGPAIVTSGSLSGAAQYNEPLTFTPPTFTGDPTPDLKWSWINEQGNVLQAGGLTFTPWKALIGSKIRVMSEVSNPAGLLFDYTPYVTVAGSEPAFSTSGTLVGSAIIGDGSTLTYIPAKAVSPDDTPIVTWKWYIKYPDQPQPVDLLRDNMATVTFLNDNGKWTEGVVSVVATATNKAGQNQVTSNTIGPMLGSPRILSTGSLFVTAVLITQRQLNYTPCTVSSPTPITSNNWFALVQDSGQGFNSPATSIRLNISSSNKTATGGQTIVNQYGATTFTPDPINVGPVS